MMEEVPRIGMCKNKHFLLEEKRFFRYFLIFHKKKGFFQRIKIKKSKIKGILRNSDSNFKKMCNFRNFGQGPPGIKKNYGEKHVEAMCKSRILQNKHDEAAHDAMTLLLLA